MFQQPKDKVKASGSRAGESFWTEESNNFGMKMMKGMGWEQGKGLGKNEDGQKQYLRAKYKADAKGIGATEKQEDATWRATQDLYTEMLQRVKAETAAAAAASPTPEGPDMSVEVTESTTTSVDPATNTTTVLRQHIQRRTLYGRFKKAKDTANYSATAMSEIFGRKPTGVPEGPWGKPEATGSAIVDGSVKKVKGEPKEETKVKFEAASPPTVNEMQSTSKLSIRDYFAQKLAAAGKLGGMTAAQFANKTEHQVKAEALDEEDDARHGGLGHAHAAALPPPPPAHAPGFTEDQQESYYNRMMASAIGGKGVQTGRSAKVGLGFGGAGYGANAPSAGLGLGYKPPSALLTAKKSIKIDADAPPAAVSTSGADIAATSPVAAYEEETIELEAVSADKEKKMNKAEKKLKRKREQAEAEEAEAAAHAAAAAAKEAAAADGGDEKSAKKAKKAAKREAAAQAESEAAAAAAAAEPSESDRKEAKKAKKAEKRAREAEEEAAAAKAAAAAAMEVDSAEKKKSKKKKKSKEQSD